MTETNPLQQYFRASKLYLKLPSGTAYYNTDVVEFNESGELSIMPMTAKDEILTKNPDALLNGDALTEIIASCVPGVKQPKSLLSNDVDALMIAIRHASYGEEIDVEATCPSCKHDNSYSVNLTNSIASMNFLDPEYKIDLESGIVIYVRPFSYKDAIAALQMQFEEFKAARAISADNVTDETRLKLFSESYQKIAQTNIDLLANSIYKITTPGESEPTVVESREFINEFLSNTDKDTFRMVDDLIKEINQVGVKKTFSATCVKCDHVWETGIDFNPVNFFTNS